MDIVSGNFMVRKVKLSMNIL